MQKLKLALVTSAPGADNIGATAEWAFCIAIEIIRKDGVPVPADSYCTVRKQFRSGTDTSCEVQI